MHLMLFASLRGQSVHHSNDLLAFASVNLMVAQSKSIHYVHNVKAVP